MNWGQAVSREENVAYMGLIGRVALILLGVSTWFYAVDRWGIIIVGWATVGAVALLNARPRALEWFTGQPASVRAAAILGLAIGAMAVSLIVSSLLSVNAGQAPGKPQPPRLTGVLKEQWKDFRRAICQPIYQLVIRTDPNSEYTLKRCPQLLGVD